MNTGPAPLGAPGSHACQGRPWPGGPPPPGPLPLPVPVSPPPSGGAVGAVVVVSGDEAGGCCAGGAGAAGALGVCGLPCVGAFCGCRGGRLRGGRARRGDRGRTGAGRAASPVSGRARTWVRTAELSGAGARARLRRLRLSRRALRSR